MNNILTEISKDSISATPFFKWFNNKYPNKLGWFTNTEFIEQLGYFILYFEERYNLHINCAENGFLIFYAKPALAVVEMQARLEADLDYYIHKELYTADKCVKSVFITYERAILYLFKTVDIPF